MLFRREKEIRSSTYTLKDAALAEMLGIEVDGISEDKTKEATYFTCLRILSDTVSKLPLKLYKETDNGTEKANAHYLYSKMKLRPNDFMSSSDFWKMVEFQRNHFGHAVVPIVTGPHGKVESLHPLDMGKVTIWIDNAGIIGKDSSIWYVYNDGSKEHKFNSKEVLHFKGMTSDGIQGMAIRDYLKTTVENLQYGTSYTNSFFKGGLSARGLLQYTGDIEPNAMNRMKSRFESMSTGLKNAGKILPVPIGFSFSTINATMADAQFLELNNLSIRQIAAAFGIKQHMVNDLSGAKFNNVSQQNEEFYRDTLQSILTMYEQEMTYKLLTEDERKSGHFFQFNVDSILRSDLKTRYEAYGLGIEKGFLTPNEVRTKEDMPTIEGGDQLIVNGTMVNLKNVGAAYAAGPAPEGGENT